MTVLLVGIVVLIILIFLAIAIGIPLSMHIARKSGAPFWPTPKKVMRRAMQEVGLTPGEIFYDLGAGTGTSLIIAADEFGARASGTEINILPYVIARTKIFFLGSLARMKFESFFDQDISDAHVVFCFLTERTMKKLEPKLKTELKPGTRIVCYTFPFPTLKPTKIIPIKGNWKLFVYTI
jgi:hypothetical protein